MILVDSNTWIYFFDESLPEHSRVADRLEALLEDEELLVSTIIQMEVAHYVVRRMGDRAGPVLEAFFELPAQVAGLGGDEAKAAVALLHELRREGLGGRDAAVLQAALAHDVALLATSDKALAKAARSRNIKTRDLAA